MNFEQLAGLIKAGFNEEQIKNISSIMGTGTDTGTGTNPGTNTPTPTPTTTPAPTETPKPADPPAPTPEPKAESETVTLLKEMLGIIQKGNIGAVGTGTIPEQTGADVLAEILNPTPTTK